MKTTKMLTILVVALGLIFCSAKVSKAPPILMGTAFTYQGHLYDTNYPADGLYDFQFKLYDTNSGPTQLGGDVNIPDTDVIDGYFTVELDFGAGVFDGNAVWLEIGVRPGEMNDPNAYTPLSPRQEVTPTPYAIYAETAGATLGGISGSGTNNRIAKFTSSSTIGNSAIYESSQARIGIRGAPFWTGAFGPDLHVHSGAEFIDVWLGDANSTNGAELGRLSFVGHCTQSFPPEMVYSGITGKIIDSSILFKGALLFYTRSPLVLPSGGGLEERMRISYDGKVGIGTDNPTEARLVVDPIVAEKGIYIHGTSDSEIEMGPSTANIYANGPFYLGPKTDNDLYFVTQGVGSAKITIKNNGVVGIGTMSPKNKLDVEGGMAVGTSYSGTNTAPSNGMIIQGKVGIGTPTPEEELHVNGDILLNYGESLMFKDSTGTKAEVLSMWYDGGNNGIDITNFAAGRIALLTGSTPGGCGNVLTVTPEGYVIIGATPEMGGSTPSEELHVEGKVWIKEMDGTASGALVRWYNGRLCQDTSSERYKEDIQPLQDDFYKILAVNPKSFVDKTSSQKEIGFIAEEFDKLGLGNLVIYNKNGQPDALKYELVSLYLLEITKEQVETTKQLKAENQLLKQRLVALEKMAIQHQFANAKEVHNESDY